MLLAEMSVDVDLLPALPVGHKDDEVPLYLCDGEGLCDVVPVEALNWKRGNRGEGGQ